MASKINRGLTWSRDEIKCLIEIWSDEHIAQQLSRTHKNTEIYLLFSERLKQKGFNRSVEQCRAKAKKLRQQYIKVRDALRKTGSSGEEKDKFVWFDKLDQILGTNPVVNPVDVVDSYEPTEASSANSGNRHDDVPDDNREYINVTYFPNY